MKIYFLQLIEVKERVSDIRQNLADRIYVGMLKEYERQTPGRFKDLPIKVRRSILKGDISPEDLLDDTSAFIDKILPEFN